MGFLGTTEMLIIAGVIVLLFGASKLPKLGGAVGESIKNFKKGVKDDTAQLQDEQKAEANEETESKQESKQG
jgi:sec-independent protein translocase protein TatA